MDWELGDKAETAGWDPYLDWSMTLLRRSPWRSVVTQNLPEGFFGADAAGSAGAPAPAGDDTKGFALYEPIFVRATKTKDPAGFFKLVENDSTLRYEPLERLIAENRPAGTPIEVFLYARVLQVPATETSRGRPFYDILHVGSPVEIDSGRKPRDFAIDRLDRAASKVALGIIDDGICYLNHRFTLPAATSPARWTRFLSFWHQSLAKSDATGALHVGSVLAPATLDTFLAAATAETELYRRENRRIYPQGLTQTNLQLASHGTHILDLAAGGAELADVPLIGAQLPPDAVDDTSGARLETHLLQALRWMILVARGNGINDLVVNASLGVLAGPKDGSKFLEQQIDREIALAAHPALKSPVNVDIVLPFGSEYETRQVAEIESLGTTGASVGLCLQRDDRTASYVEIRPQERDDAIYEADLGALEVTLVAPDGTRLGPLRPAPGFHVDIIAVGNTVARLYRTKVRPGAIGGRRVRSYLALAFAPTGVLPPETGTPAATGWQITAPSGRWRIDLHSSKPDAGPVTLQIQRDDAAVGYKVVGRQAYFEADPGGDWNPEHRDHSGLGAGPITHAGTNNAYATSRSKQVHPVGSALVRQGKPPVVKPARYASEGATWTVRAPEAAALTETGRTGSGITASGSASGSAAQLVGSSVAAATYSRALVHKRLGKTALCEVGNTAAHARLGATTIVRNPAIRRRDG